MFYSIFTDGGARPKCKDSAIGVYAVNPAHSLRFSKYINYPLTNNQTEYLAIMHGMIIALNLNAHILHIYSDSQLTINQLKGAWVINNPILNKLFILITTLSYSFDTVTYHHVPRTNPGIKIADNLVREAYHYHDTFKE